MCLAYHGGMRGMPVRKVAGRGYHGTDRNLTAVEPPNRHGQGQVFGFAGQDLTYFLPTRGSGAERKAWTWAQSAANKSLDKAQNESPEGQQLTRLYDRSVNYNLTEVARARASDEADRLRHSMGPNWGHSDEAGRPRVYVTNPKRQQWYDSNLHGERSLPMSFEEYDWARVTPRQSIRDVRWGPPPIHAQDSVEMTLPHVNWRQFNAPNWVEHASSYAGRSNRGGIAGRDLYWYQSRDENRLTLDSRDTGDQRWDASGYRLPDSQPEERKPEVRGQMRLPGSPMW